MTLIATESQRLSNLLKWEAAPHIGYCRLTVTATEAAQKTYSVGTVLGKVTATGKYKILDPAASDGSESFAGLVVSDGLGRACDFTVAATTDTKVVVLQRGPAAVADGAVMFGPGVDNQAKKDTIFAAMEAVGIMVLKQI